MSEVENEYEDFTTHKTNQEQGIDFPKTLYFEPKVVADVVDVLSKTKHISPKESDDSLAYHLLQSLHLNDFQSRLKSLESQVILVDPSNLCEKKNAGHGRVCIHKVEVKHLNGQLTVQEVKQLVTSILMLNFQGIVNEAADAVFSMEEIQTICLNIDVISDGQHIGTICYGSYPCRSPIMMRQIKEILISKTLEKVGQNFADFFLRDIFKQTQKIVKELNQDEVNVKILKDFTINAVDRLVKSVTVADKIRYWGPTLGIRKVAAAVRPSLVTLVRPIDVNSFEWRNTIAKEIYENILAKKTVIIGDVLHKIRSVYDHTEKELMEVYAKLEDASKGIPLVDQRKLIGEWLLRDFKIENIELCPSILHYITGRKNDNPVMKVFVLGNVNTAKTFCKLNVKNEPENANYEFVDVSLNTDAKNESLTKRHSISMDKEKHINIIIQEERESIFAKHSNVIAIGMSPIKYSGDQIVQEPCIAIYCLDTNLIPFGEEEIPKFLRDIPCDILEDFILFGSCENCQTLDHGCSIGKKGEKSSGTLGFFVKRKNNSLDSSKGFLTASHVALNGNIINTLLEKRLSDSDFRNEVFEIVHPSFEDSNASKVIGNVKDSFFGNYNSVGVDAAFVKTDEFQLELSDETSNQPFSFSNNSTENELVVKMGRTTGKTKGIWLKSCPYSVKQPLQSPHGVYFSLNNCLCIENMGTESFFEPGDSGAAVYVISKGNIQQPLGLAIGKTTSKHSPPVTLACHIESILNVLELSIFEPAQPMEIS
ncbi:uncharacterized protein LOC134235594 [Saccostrea cucullata]|uniref:uncharacterized protein LOC134235594 n=1 Tax=Saccostrea cuccullata TaxID=36930 RepID=UPI002ED3E965